ncbi:hypothetical protein [Sphingobacterium sp. SYP-B4668]|uniref:hypothetical protein n=1 Tax=Sphingobacterium sp. SYP-B4668 TaxID=2996035 RepID=UPI0022DD6C18|nr:hypothetical protein [Sphingobacterium sp. SYP-B4668]
MDVEKIIRDKNIYFAKEVIAGIPCTVGYIKKFRWRWLATQLNTFIIIGEIEGTIQPLMIRNFSKSCYQYAISHNKGWPRGLQSGIGSIAILIGAEMTQEAAAYCMGSPEVHYSAFEIPVAYLKKYRQSVKYTGTQLWGGIYYPYFNSLINEFVGQLSLLQISQTPPSLPPLPGMSMEEGM